MRKTRGRLARTGWRYRSEAGLATATAGGSRARHRTLPYPAKAKAKVNAIYRKVANLRNDFLHQTTTAISKNHAISVIEDPKVRTMSKLTAGTKEDPGSTEVPA